nr:MAG TPA: hypothetical protein [Caudoviricetes sp.]
MNPANLESYRVYYSFCCQGKAPHPSHGGIYLC